MTASELRILPSGHLHWTAAPQRDTGGEDGKSPNAIIGAAFSRGISDGLIALGEQADTTELPPILGYWRTFACRYLAARCRMTQGDPGAPEAIAAPDERQLKSLLDGAPPMPGAEYLSPAALEDLWFTLDAWMCGQIRQQGGLDAVLEAHAPRWHQVGRVCFHLAENRLDRDCPFAFLATYAPEVSPGSQHRIRHKPLGSALQEYAGARNRQLLIRLLSPVQRAAEASPLVKGLVDTGDLYHPLAWTADEAYEFLQEVPLYEHSGVVVRVPDWWKKRPRPQVGVTIGNARQTVLGADTLLDFEVNVALGAERLTADELEGLLAAQDGLAFIKGQWVEINREKLTEVLAHWKRIEANAAKDGLSFTDGMRLLAGAPATLADGHAAAGDRQWAFVKPGAWLESLLDELRAPETLASVDPGRALKTELRPYQKTGVNWLWLLSQLGLGACLADDMGLGKTMQVIALLLVLKRRRAKTPSLLVMPASLLANWKFELERFAPSLRCKYLHPSQMSRQDADSLASDGALAGTDLVLTTYGMLLRQPWLKDRKWQLLILDEAQAIKNAASRQTRAAKKLQAGARIVLSGTPIENRLGDLWSLFDFLLPGLLGSAARFKRFVKSLSAAEGDQYAPLRRLVRPYILRRLKTDKSIISDLPEKTEVRAWCVLSKAQGALYTREVRKLASALETLDGIERRGLVLASLMRFKQICNHPSQLLGDGIYDPGNSGKFARLGELCDEIASRQEKVLVFTQFRVLAEPLAAFLAGVFGRSGLLMHGGTAVRQRRRRVDEFQEEGGPPFFVLSLKAGGVGLNLTAASHVVHFDRWWNPAVENQATDRAFRIGQRNNVLVHKFVCQGTVEEKIDALISAKTALADDILEGGAETLLTEMGNEELLQLVSLDVDSIKV